MKYLSQLEMQKPRSRRLRKKLHIGEFKEYGFSLDITFDKNKALFDAALDSLLEFVEMNNWVIAGGGDSNSDIISGFVCKWSKGSLTEEDSLMIKRWLREQDWVLEFTVHKLQDAWHV